VNDLRRQLTFAAYRSYHEELARAVLSLASGADPSAVRAGAHLDGLPYERLRRDIPLHSRRNYSTFFTSTSLRTRLVTPYRRRISAGATVLDPACGIGDLLLAAQELLPRRWSVINRRQHIASHFYGRDLVNVLVDIARDRLTLATMMAAKDMKHDRQFAFSNIRTGDGLHETVPYFTTDLVLLNPPFGRRVLPSSETWGEGLTSEAAPFTLEVLRRVRPGAYVAAILPDVLRSGTRYGRWRDHVERVAEIKRVEVVGLFDPWTDVDVFIAHFRRLVNNQHRKVSSRMVWNPNINPALTTRTLGHLAQVAIGDVVPHRHPEEGPEVPYLTVHSVPPGVRLLSAPQRRFSGRLHKAPFIVVRRTSAPTRGSGPRLEGSIVDPSLGEVAVENHLIVIKPISGGVAECEKLCQQLSAPSVTSWLNARIRTRHLTKSALLELPLLNSDEPHECTGTAVSDTMQ
jgi:hypothetical protein